MTKCAPIPILEINRIDDLASLRQDWDNLLEHTSGASFFQSLEWLEIFWRHFGEEREEKHENRLRVLVVPSEGRPSGILPLVVRSERTNVGRLRVLTFPLHAWGSFYGPIGPNPAETLAAGLEHVRNTPRDWDFLELRWLGGPGANPLEIRNAMTAAGFQAYPTVWNRTAVVDLDGTWESYWASRNRAWLRRFRQNERRLAEQGELKYVRYRPKQPGDPRWDLYDICEEIARRSWQASATDGTTLSHASIRDFLRETHAAAAARGQVDMNLLYLGDSPAAFIYGYCCRDFVYGLRRGYDAGLSRHGAGNVLLARMLCDSFARGDRLYDMGVGSLETKRRFLTRTVPILRFSHFSSSPWLMQLLRLRRWWQKCDISPSW
jgi:CelD/BcsL family acetyltransferase involved in cellulose biosynthesis